MRQLENQFEIIKFDMNNYEPISKIQNIIYPDHPITADELAKIDRERPSTCHCERWIAKSRNNIIAFGGYCQYQDTYKQGVYTLTGGVIPQYRNLGIGKELFDIVLKRLKELNSTSLLSHSRADRISSIQFLVKRGFVEYMREVDWELDITLFDQAPYQIHLERLKNNGISINSISELKNDPERDRKLYDLEHILLDDTTGSEHRTRLTFDQWINSKLHRPEIIPDGYFVAVKSGHYVGKTHFEKFESSDKLYTKLTGVVSSHRRQGIGLALKVYSVTWAQKQGYTKIITDNEINNTPIYKLNHLLGFKKLPEWIFFNKSLM